MEEYSFITLDQKSSDPVRAAFYYNEGTVDHPLQVFTYTNLIPYYRYIIDGEAYGAWGSRFPSRFYAFDYGEFPDVLDIVAKIVQYDRDLFLYSLEAVLGSYAFNDIEIDQVYDFYPLCTTSPLWDLYNDYTVHDRTESYYGTVFNAMGVYADRISQGQGYPSPIRPKGAFQDPGTIGYLLSFNTRGRLFLTRSVSLDPLDPYESGIGEYLLKNNAGIGLRPVYYYENVYLNHKNVPIHGHFDHVDLSSNTDADVEYIGVTGFRRLSSWGSVRIRQEEPTARIRLKFSSFLLYPIVSSYGFRIVIDKESIIIPPSDKHRAGFRVVVNGEQMYAERQGYYIHIYIPSGTTITPDSYFEFIIDGRYYWYEMSDLGDATITIYRD